MDYPEEQLWELYKSIPKDLQKAVVSKKTADTIYDSCVRHGLNKEKIREVIKHACYVLLGIIPPKELEQTLGEELKLTRTSAKKISREINSFVFLPLRKSLETLYNTKIPGEIKAPPAPLDKRPQRKDKYRENIE